MVERPADTPKGGLRGPVARVNTDMCIGCGLCQYQCPAYPDKAILVNGIV